MVESSESNPLAIADKVEKIFWIVNNSKYDELRKIEGCTTLWDLNATPVDVQVIKKMAKGLGVKDENLYHDEEATLEAMKASYMKILKASRKMSANEVPHVIMTYCGGHGATQNEKQVYLLNDSNASNAVF